MRRLRLLPSLAALLFGVALPAQDEDPSLAIAEAIETILMPEVMTRLRSERLPTIAWGAHLAGRHRLAAAVPELRRKLVDLTAVDDDEKRFALLAILDALIRTGAEVPSGELLPHARGVLFAPCLVLLARDPERNGDVLMDLFRRHDDDGRRRVWLSAGNLLASAEADGFAALLLARIPQKLEVWVADPDGDFSAIGFGRGIAGRHGDARMDVPLGYPPTVLYRLAEEGETGDRLLAPGPVPIYYRRLEHTARSFGFGSNETFDHAERPEMRLRWLARMLGRRHEWMEFQLERREWLRWQGADSYLEAVVAARDELEAQFDELVARCVKKGLLEPGGAPEHEIAVAVEDRRSDKSEALPELGR